MNAWLLQNTSFLSALTAAHFLLLRPKKVSKEKATPAYAPLRGSRPKRGWRGTADSGFATVKPLRQRLKTSPTSFRAALQMGNSSMTSQPECIQISKQKPLILSEYVLYSPRIRDFYSFIYYRKIKSFLPSSAVPGPLQQRRRKVDFRGFKTLVCSTRFDASKSLVRAAPQKLAFRRVPEGRGCRGCLSFAYFSLAKQRKVSRHQGEKDKTVNMNLDSNKHK